MTKDDILHVVAEAFARVPRPDTFVIQGDWTGSEYSELADTLAQRDNDTLTANDLKGSTVLLTTDALRYFMPALVRLSFWNDCDISDLYSCFVENTLCVPFPRDNIPNHHPETPKFTRDQSLAALAFLQYLKDTMVIEGDPHPEVTARLLDRGIRNWKHFVSQFESTSANLVP